MSLFWMYATALLLAVFVLVFVPLSRVKEKGARRTMMAIFLIVPLTAILLYQAFSNYDPEATGAGVDPVEDMVAGLESRLARDGGSAAEWSMLGRSYVTMGRFQEAVPVYARVNEMTSGEDPGVLIAYAESLALADRESLKHLGAELLDKALAILPSDTRGLWWGGVSAMERGDDELAAQRWQALLKLDPPEALAKTVREQLSRTGVRIAEEDQVPDIRIPIEIKISEELAQRISPNMILFLFARAPDVGGPPLAVVRHVAGDLPLSVELGQDNVMLPNTVLADHDELRLVARISRSGSPGAQPGDFFGEIF
ncbi:MAG: hypothetical protein IH809_07985, partial [Proteobacteria bacterium]|nr:hypothetical protein [Pseudomonadota bacterium]